MIIYENFNIRWKSGLKCMTQMVWTVIYIFEVIDVGQFDFKTESIWQFLTTNLQ